MKSVGLFKRRQRRRAFNEFRRRSKLEAAALGQVGGEIVEAFLSAKAGEIAADGDDPGVVGRRRGQPSEAVLGGVEPLHLTALCDDKGAQIVYAPAPVVRQAVLDEHPDIAVALDPVFASLSLETLQALNARIAVAGEDAGAVAADYLKQKHFLP